MNDEKHQGRIIVAYRKAKQWSQEDLARALRVTTRTVQRMEKLEMIQNISRRRLLVGLLGIPAALFGLEEKQNPIEKTTLAINNDRITFFEEEMATHWDMYHTGGTIRVARGLDMWINEITKLVQSSKTSLWQPRTLTLLTMSHQLQACVLRDRMNYNQAHMASKKAITIARELGDQELIASALVREGMTYLHQDRVEEAIKYLNGALQISAHIGVPHLRGYALQALSEAYAKAQKPQETWQCIAMAERMLERQNSKIEHSEARYNFASLTAQQGINAVLLHDYEHALSLIDRSMTNYDPTRIRGKARLIAQKADAYSGLGYIEESTITAEEALTLAHSVGSSKTVARIKDLHTTLIQSQWKREPSVARLGALLEV